MSKEDRVQDKDACVDIEKFTSEYFLGEISNFGQNGYLRFTMIFLTCTYIPAHFFQSRFQQNESQIKKRVIKIKLNCFIASILGYTQIYTTPYMNLRNQVGYTNHQMKCRSFSDETLVHRGF